MLVLSKPIVLVADDNPDVRELTKLLLEFEGCVVIEAADGREAVQVALVSTLDLILLDIQMPLMDGLEVARELRRNDSTRSIPIIAVTANDDVRRETIAAGCNACLAKPLLPDAIGKILTKYLGDPSRVERSPGAVATIG
jgi:CheY-like chemotaxis protein